MPKSGVKKGSKKVIFWSIWCIWDPFGASGTPFGASGTRDTPDMCHMGPPKGCASSIQGVPVGTVPVHLSRRTCYPGTAAHPRLESAHQARLSFVGDGPVHPSRGSENPDIFTNFMTFLPLLWAKCLGQMSRFYDIL